MAVIIYSDTIVDPRAVTLICQCLPGKYEPRVLLVMLCHAAIAPFTMLASQRHSNHAWNAKVLLIKLPQAQQLVYDNLLLCETAKLRNKPRLIEHCAEVEIPAKSIEYSENKVAERIR
jgi:hypothetical protein